MYKLPESREKMKATLFCYILRNFMVLNLITGRSGSLAITNRLKLLRQLVWFGGDRVLLLAAAGYRLKRFSVLEERAEASAGFSRY
jgi:hypothetical protein